MNPLYNQLGCAGMKMPGPMGDFQNMIRQFQQFKANFKGDPEQEVRRLLQSGQMTQQQLDQLQQAATMLQGLLGA